MSDCAGIILAAGEGTRMKSGLPKVLHQLCGKAMIDYVIEALQALKLKKIIVVANKRQEQLLSYLAQHYRKQVTIAIQRKPLGTADALKAGLSVHMSATHLLVMCADTPLVRIQTLQSLLQKHKGTNANCTILTALVENSSGLGRIIRDEVSKVSRIVEELDTNFSQRQIREINSGIYCFRMHELVQILNQIPLNAKKGEYYLTDIVHILYSKSKKIETIDCGDATEIIGINYRLDLSKANESLRMRIIERLAEGGVTVTSPHTTFINYDAVIGKDTIIHPFTVIESNVTIGENCSVGPFCHLRPGTVVKDTAKVGNFAEMVRSKLGRGSRFKHFGYLGDATIGEDVNIGAGTVIANYDGKKKNQTIIKDGAFIGSDTVIVAPAVIGKKAATGAGAIVTKSTSVKDHCVVVGVPARPLVKHPAQTQQARKKTPHKKQKRTSHRNPIQKSRKKKR